MKRLAPAFLALCALFVFVGAEALAQEPIFVELGLSKDIFYHGDYMHIYLNVGNTGFDVIADAYLSLTTPDGTVLYAPGFSPLGQPYQTQVHIPAGETGWFYHTYYRIPSLRLPLHEPGHYTFSLWLCATGTAERITLESTQSFKIIPCELDSWVNDNYIYGVSVDENGIWTGLTDGVQLVSFDDSRRQTWSIEDGVKSSFTKLFDSPTSILIAGGQSVGLPVRESYGWRTILSEPGSENYVYGVRSVVTDLAGYTWVIHRWPGFFTSDANLLGMSPLGEAKDYSYHISGEIQDLCLTNVGDACVVASDGLHVFNGESFDFHEIAELGSSAEVQKAYGDGYGNVWLGAVVEGVNVLLKHDLDASETAVYDETTPGLLPPTVSDMTSDSEGNVWFAMMDGVSWFDGDVFSSLPTFFHATSIAAGPDDTIYCGSDGAGLYRLVGGAIQDYVNDNPDIREAEYSFTVGLAEGGAIIADPSTQQPLEGYESFDGQSWETIGDDGSLPVKVTGVFEGEGHWAWDTSEVYLKLGDTWVDTTGGSAAQLGTVRGVLENDDGQAFLLTSQALLTFEGAAWTPVEAPSPQSPEGYTGLMIDHSGAIYIYDHVLGLEVRSPEGDWTRIDESVVLPAQPEVVALAESGIAHICGHHPEDGEYMIEIDGPFHTMHSFQEHGQPVEEVSSIAYDLAGRVWMLGMALDNSPKAVIFDPSDTSWKSVDEVLGLLPHNSNNNTALRNNMFDRSFGKYGTLWWAGFGGPKRLNLAPQARIMIDKAGDVYVAGDAAQIQAHFTNYAGSIAVDWYAALQLWDGPHFYWVPNFETGESEWVTEETPALRDLTVPTDTSFVYDLGEVIIPEYAWDGHYKWCSGFKRAGEDEWLGVGFPSYDEFCVLVALDE